MGKATKGSAPFLRHQQLLGLDLTQVLGMGPGGDQAVGPLVVHQVTLDLPLVLKLRRPLLPLDVGSLLLEREPRVADLQLQPGLHLGSRAGALKYMRGP